MIANVDAAEGIVCLSQASFSSFRVMIAISEKLRGTDRAIFNSLCTRVRLAELVHDELVPQVERSFKNRAKHRFLSDTTHAR